MSVSVRGEGLVKRFGRGEAAVRALDGVSIALDDGVIAALLGPSGSGKSTLVKALGLVQLPDEGVIHFRDRVVARDGLAVADLAELRRSHLGFVFQKANLVSFLSARENVEIAARIGGQRDPRARAEELLAYLDVGHRAKAYPEELSGGEQQRVAIARALANRPALVLADEPTAALDKERGRAVMELLKRVAHEQGASVLVVTHDHRAMDVFDVVYEMEDGRLTGPLARSRDDAHAAAPTSAT
jgi:putative ABC transport system ATP-binding protein